MEASSTAAEQRAGERGIEERPAGLNLQGKKRVEPKPSADYLNSPRPHGVSRMPLVLKELLTSTRPRLFSRDRDSLPAVAVTTEYLPSPHTPSEDTASEYNDREDVKVLKIGTLHKTSQSRRTNAEPGPTRLRRFRLTAESLEYFQQFSHVKIRRSYPLTSLEGVEFPVDGDTQEFKLLFATYMMTLRSDSERDVEEWVEAIRNAWKEWQLPTPVGEPELMGVASPANPPITLHLIVEVDEGEEEGEGEREREMAGSATETHASAQRHRASSGQFGSHTTSSSPPPGPAHHTHSPPPVDRPRSNTHTGFLRRESTEVEYPTYDKRRHQHRIRGLIKRKASGVPQLQKQQPHNADTLSSKLHEDHAMIKYPRSKKWSIPAEKIVNLDKDNLVVIWKHNERVYFRRKESSTKHRLKSSLALHKVLEIRKGQLTEKFDKFPYEEVENQSFSLIFEQVTNRYVRLTSLDLICDSPEKCEDWILGLRETTNHLSCSVFPSELYDNTDPIILWLKRLWAVSQIDHEMSQKTAQDMLLMFRPGTIQARCRQILSDSHRYQFRHTYLRGNALRWDGFVLMFNLLCGITTGRLGSLFKQYAVKYPRLGLTEEELRAFLKKECQWSESSCSSPSLQALISHHDYHHRAYKKCVAQGIPLEYQIGSTLLSYAGFLSFLRSKDNSPINLEHTAQFMDMSQPLSHYFINSSHNTYLEADQLYGKSSTDAYIRVLLQGCRCIEIDCWDDRLNVTGVGEPIIYHGYTLTTKLPFREVIQTIKEYAFTASFYPLIISIENHCSLAQQTKMAKIFQAVMGDVLPKENLCEKEGKERLPSPQELQGKIILKGSFKLSKSGAGGGKRTPKHENSRGQALSVDVNTSIPTSPNQNEPPIIEQTAVALLQSRQQLPLRRPLHRSASSLYRSHRQHLQSSVHELKESGQLESTVYQDDDQELIFSETVGDMKSLIVYCRAISLRPWSFERQAQTPVSNMFSFGEPSALRRCEKYPTEMLACTERQLVRTYPRGTRFDSSNYSAMTMWQCGIQMVALNFQYPDVNMHLNQGLFRMNGGCGYVLKPKVMRQVDKEYFYPRMTTPHPDVTPINLEIELLSGQQLRYWDKKCLSCTVDIHTYGIPHDTDTTSMAPAQSGDLLWPQWEEGKHVFQNRVLMPELCLVYFRVEVTHSRRTGRKTTLYGQNCIPLVSLLPGIKYVPLRTPGGELLPESGLFLRIRKEEEQEVERRQEEEKGERKGGMRGVARQRRKLPRQQELANDPLDIIDVTASIFPSRRLEPERDEEEYEEYEEEEEEGGGYSVQRSLTSPPLLEAFTRHQQPSADTAKEVAENGRRRNEIVAEIHGSEFELTLHHSPGEETCGTNGNPVAQLISIQPSLQGSVGGKSGEDEEQEGGEKTFSLKFSDSEL